MVKYLVLVFHTDFCIEVFSVVRIVNKSSHMFMIMNSYNKNYFRLKEVYILKILFIVSSMFFFGAAASSNSLSAKSEERERHKESSKIQHKNGDTTIIESNEGVHRVVMYDSKGIIKREWSGKSAGMTHEQVVNREKFPNKPKAAKKIKEPRETKGIPRP